ncbi:MAG TPA: 16S rRNA (cytosine(967)-C(5))-methyltransferase RsmB [Thermoleophilaceae bacterium]|nr:16S rRNA (cytosine(967)-C(5))-methyltransferase RsmB [Thermoleophilaceae bacterium]
MVRLTRHGRRTAHRAEPTPARACAFRVLQRTFGEGAYADRAFRAEAERAGLDPRDRAFAQRLAYGTIQNRATIDYVVTALSSRVADSIDLPILNALRLGVYQVAFLDGVPDHAAVGETVDLAKEHGRGGHRLVNAVLRRATREAGDLMAELTDHSPAEAAVRHSHPEWIVRMWWDALGPEQAIALLERNNAPAENAVRANALLVTAGEVAEGLAKEGVETSPAEDLREGLVLQGQFDVHASKLFREGALMPQSRASMLVARVVAPEPGERVLDLCAAPGGKTTHLAALLGNEGEVVAVEKNGGRARALAENCERLGATCVRVREGDAAEIDVGEDYDRVLLDPPCSDLGTLQSRPDVRWKKDEGTVARVVVDQARLLDIAAERVRPGGSLVYSTCTISPEENEHQVASFIERRGDFSVDDLSERFGRYAHPSVRGPLQVLPHRHGTDGFFISRLVRAG